MNARVAVLVPGLPWGGGVPAVAEFLCKALEESGRYRVDVISVACSYTDQMSTRLLSPRSWLMGPQITEGVWSERPFRYFGADLAELEFMRYQPRRALTLELNTYDIILVVAGSPVWALLTRDVRPPVLAQVATLLEVERASRSLRERGLAGAWRRLMTRIASGMEIDAIQHVNTVFVENDWMRRHLECHWRSCGVVYAPPGVDTDLFHPTSSVRRREYILSVGRFSDPRKNVELLFRSYHLFRQMVPNAPRLVIAGKSGPSDESWRYAVNLGITQFVDTKIGLSAQELAGLYRNAELFVLTSDEEGFGMVLLEAMASGLPVVSTRCGGPDALVNDGENGYFAPVGDALCIAERMRDIFSAGGARRAMMAEAARRTAVDRFSNSTSARPYLQKFDELSGFCMTALGN